MRQVLIRRRHFFVLLLGLGFVVCVVTVTQRPRPSYLFAFTVCIMALIGMSADLLTRRRVRWAIDAIALLAAAALVVLLPFYQITHASPRPLYMNVTRLQPYQSLLAAEDGKLLIGDYAGELGFYLRYGVDSAGRSLAGHLFSTYDYSVLSEWDHQQPLEAFLAGRGFAALFVQPRMMAEFAEAPAAQALLEGGTQYRRLNPVLDRDWGLYALIPPRFPVVPPVRPTP
jgi:hypothetical protein